MERNFSSPSRFRNPKVREELDWATLKEVSRVPLKKMSRNISRKFNGGRRLGTTLYSRRSK